MNHTESVFELIKKANRTSALALVLSFVSLICVTIEVWVQVEMNNNTRPVEVNLERVTHFYAYCADSSSVK